MRAGQVALIVAIMVLPALVRAQSATRAARVISVHPRAPTIFHLPEAIENAWITDRDDFELVIVGKELYVRPRPGTRAGVEGTIEVKTPTRRWTLRVRVVARARDAASDVLVLSAEPDPGIEEEEGTPGMPGMIEEDIWAEPPEPDPGIEEGERTPGMIEEDIRAEPLAASEPAKTPSPALPAADAPAEPARADAPSEPPTKHDEAVDTRGGDTVARRPRLDLSAHVVLALGVTAVNLAGYEPRAGLQPLQALGLRLAGARRGALWATELDVSAERLGGSLTYARAGTRSPGPELSGPWLRAMLSVRATLEPGGRWIPSACAGIGAQAHLRSTKNLDNRGDSSTMMFGGLLTLGMGLQYRTRDFLLGVEFRVWHGGPDEYRSIGTLLTLGRVLDQGDAP
jgi:hypothetical protein